MMEKRLTTRLMAYWDKLRGEQPYPDYVQFNKEMILDLWPRCMHIKIVSPGPTALYMYDFMGAELAKAYGKDLVGEYVNKHMPNFPGARVLKMIDHVVHEPKCMEDSGQFINSADKIVKYRACMLPFGPLGKGVSDVIVGLSWMEF